MTRLASAGAREPTRRTLARFAGTGIVAFGFYLALGDPTDPFDLVTGLASAVVVAAVLGGVTFERSPSLATVGALARAVVFLPVLLWAVVRANLSLVAVVLDPELPIDPAVVRVPAPEGAVARALLADDLVVHTLTVASREELLEGSLARAVAFVTGEPAAGGEA